MVISASAAIRATRALAKYDKVQRESETPTMATSSDGACRCSRPARAARNDLGSLSELADLDTPGLRPALEIGPGELLGMLGFELVVERLGVVVVHENERRPRRELLDELEYLPVPLDRHEAAHVDHRDVRSLGGILHIWAPLVARLWMRRSGDGDPGRRPREVIATTALGGSGAACGRLFRVSHPTTTFRPRSDEHTSEIKSLKRTQSGVFSSK